MNKQELDKQMILLQQGNEEAFEVIYNDTKRGLYAFILSICKNHHTAEDIMQITYMRIRSAVSSYKPGSNALAWMFTIARNLALNELSRQKREVYSDFETGAYEFGQYTIEDKLESPLMAMMEQCLTEGELQIVTLHVISGFKHREIADMLDKPLGTVLWSYRNALGKIKKEIQKEDGNDTDD